MPEQECTCSHVADPWTYYGIVEPGGAMEPDPYCLVHFPPRWKVACINWTSPEGVPRACTYVSVANEAHHVTYWKTWDEAVVWLNDVGAHLEVSAQRTQVRQREVAEGIAQ